MKVCLLNDSFPPIIDGVANVVMNYAKIMQEKKLADVIVGTPKYPNADYESYPYKVVPYQSFDTTGIVSGYRAGNPFSYDAIKEMVSFKPDIIHTHCPISSTVMARLVRSETNAPIVFTYHTKFDVDIARAVKAEFLQKESIKVLIDNISACDEVWVVSQGAGENLKSLGYEGDYKVVLNGVDFAKGRVDDDKVATVTKKYDLPKDVPVYLFVGRMMKYKGLDIILDAMKVLDSHGKDFRMVFVGSGADAEEMQQKTKDYGLERKVIFTGAEYDREVLRAWNTRADLFLFPSNYDTNGIVVREAAACGLASILIKGSCAAEGITDCRNGYLIDSSAQDMADKLEAICSNIDKVHEVGQRAMDEIYISWEDAVKVACERYQQILELKAKGFYEKDKKDTSEYIINMAASLIGNTGKMFEIPRKLYEGMQENVGDILDEVKEKSVSVVTDIKNNVVSDIKDNVRQIKDIINND